jgi:putative ABC transport system substrate-binding protein
MVLQDAAALDTERSVGVALAVPASVQLLALKRIAPGVKRVGILYDPRFNAGFVADAERAAKVRGVTITAKAVSSARDAPAALDALMMHVDAMLMIPDATVVSKELISLVVARALEKRIPVLTYSESLVKLGVLAGLAPSYAQNGRLCAGLVKRVQGGESPRALHGSAPMTGTLVVNVAAARRLGLDLSTDLLKPPTVVVGQ